MAATGTRSWRDARRLAACTAASQGTQSAAASAAQYTAAAPPQTAQQAAAAGLVLPSLPIISLSRCLGRVEEDEAMEEIKGASLRKVELVNRLKGHVEL
nr:unnamed protein product [Digitaria exilis]